MDDVRLSDPVARRLGRFFADLMLTLAEDGTEGTEAAEAVRALWQSRTSGDGPELDAATLAHGIGAVAVALAEEVVVARRVAGATGMTVTDVWLEVVSALEPERRDDVGSASGAIDPP